MKNNYVATLKEYGFDFLKIDNQAFLLPLYMGGSEAVRQARACNRALEKQTHAMRVGLINCMAQNVLNLDNIEADAPTGFSLRRATEPFR